MQNCCTCGVEKELSCFHKDSSRTSGISNRCKQCKKESDSKYKVAHGDEKRAKGRKYYHEHAESIKEKVKVWYIANPEKAKEQRKTWHDNNKERVDENRQRWIDENAEKYEEYQRTYQRDRYRENMDYRIKTILNARIRSCLRKSKKTLEFVGCDMITFKRWIESQFDEHMTWDNMGTYWHIDHVKPCASFNFENEEDIKQCFLWSNLRPLEKRENMSKGDKVLPELISEQEQRAIQFINS